MQSADTYFIFSTSKRIRQAQHNPRLQFCLAIVVVLREGSDRPRMIKFYWRKLILMRWRF
jgi:hypothetical protein